MYFDDITKLQQIDQKNMIEIIRGLPAQIQSTWTYVLEQQNLNFQSISRIFIAGVPMYSNGIGILRTMVCNPNSKILSIQTCLNIPNQLQGRENLLIIIFDDNNAEEMQQLIELAESRNLSIFLLLHNEELINKFQNYHASHWAFTDHSFSRTTLGFDTFILYGILFKSGLVPDITDAIKTLINALALTIQYNDIHVPAAQNPAKRQAGQMVGRWVKIVAGGIMLPVARWWSDQINQSAKALCYAEDIFHLAEHSLNGIQNPEQIAQQSMVIFLKSGLNGQKMETLMDQAKIELMCNGLGTDSYSARGDDHLSQIWTTILFGDFLAYYLAIAYECDPATVMFLSE